MGVSLSGNYWATEWSADKRVIVAKAREATKAYTLYSRIWADGEYEIEIETAVKP